MSDASENGPSFDPRSWKRTAVPAGGPAVSAPAPRPASQAAGPPRAALAASAALLLAGAGMAWLSRADSPAVLAEQAPAAPAREERRTLALAGPADLAGALSASGIDNAAASAAASAAMPAMKPGEIRAVMTLRSTGDAPPVLARLAVSNADASGVIVSLAAAGGFTAEPVAADLAQHVVVRRGRMDDSSFYSSAVAAGVTDSLIPDFARALAYDFDFAREVRKGDDFEAAFEQRIDPEGREVGPPKLLFASLSTGARTASAYWFQPEGGQPGWFDRDGRSVKRALLRTPVDAARVSSSFGFRLHPVLGFMKLHRGTDFAAPTGTPIYASGDAMVEFAGPKGPNGNFVKLRHTNGWESLYLHMSAFAAGIQAGARVSQGQQIGAVGTTGRSTGPHLHYELHIDGEPVNPMSVRTDERQALAGAALAAFRRERDRIDVNRARLSG